jgi:integrase
LKRKQNGSRFETGTAFWLRFNDTTGRKVSVKIADKSETFRAWADVEQILREKLAEINGTPREPRTIAAYVEDVYLPWVRENKAAATAYAYGRVWLKWKPLLGSLTLEQLETAKVTAILTKWAKDGLGSRALSHAKWFLSGVYVFAIAQGHAQRNPAETAKWLHKVPRPAKQRAYTLHEVLGMLAILEPLNLHAAAAVALAYFGALRPAEIRGLRWEDVTEDDLFIRRAVWNQVIGETKTEDSAASVPLAGVARRLLDKVGDVYGREGFVFPDAHRRPMNLNHLNDRVIAPALKAAGVEWRGYYPCRRGIASLMTDKTTALNATGLLRHSNPATTLKHYTQAQKDAVRAALQKIEAIAMEETVQ